MSLHRKMTTVTFKAKTKKNCKPSLGPGVKTVCRRIRSINKNADPNRVLGQSRHQTTHQAFTCSVTTQQYKNSSDITVLILTPQMPVLTKHQPEHYDKRNETSDNRAIIYPLKDMKNNSNIMVSSLYESISEGQYE